MTTLILLIALAQTPDQLPAGPSKRMPTPELPSKVPPQIEQPIAPTPRPTPQGRATPQATPTPMPAQSQYDYEDQYERPPVRVAQLPMSPRIRYRVQRQLVVRETLVPTIEYDVPDVAEYSAGASLYSGGFESRVSFGGYAGSACVGGVCLPTRPGLFGGGRGWGGRVVDKRVTRFRSGPFSGF